MISIFLSPQSMSTLQVGPCLAFGAVAHIHFQVHAFDIKARLIQPARKPKVETGFVIMK